MKALESELGGRMSSDGGPWRPGVTGRSGGQHVDITDIRVFPVEEDKLRAYVTITLDHCFVVRDLKIIQGSGGLFVAMPAKRRKDGTYKDIAHPLNADTRERMERTILAEYRKQVAEGTLLTSTQVDLVPDG